MPEQLPTEPGLYAGRLGTIFRLQAGTWSHVWVRVDAYWNKICPDSEVARYMPLKPVKDEEKDD